MFRLTLIILTVIGLLLFLGAIYLVYRKLRNGISGVWERGVEVANEQQQRWKQREHIKSQPEYLQTAHQLAESIDVDWQELPSDWQQHLAPLNEAMQQVLSISMADHQRADKVRRFYNTSLPAYAAFVAKLKSDHDHLDALESEKARDNVSVFKQDFDRYLGKIQQARRFDFDVLMDVIKVRLKNR